MNEITPAESVMEVPLESDWNFLASQNTAQQLSPGFFGFFNRTSFPPAICGNMAQSRYRLTSVVCCVAVYGAESPPLGALGIDRLCPLTDAAASSSESCEVFPTASMSAGHWLDKFGFLSRIACTTTQSLLTDRYYRPLLLHAQQL